MYVVTRPYDYNTLPVKWVVEGDTEYIKFVDNEDGSCNVDVLKAGGKVTVKAVLDDPARESNTVTLNTKGVVVTKMSDGRKGHQLFPDQTIKLEFPDPTAQIEYEIYDSEDDADKEIDSKKNSKPLKVYNGEAISIEEPNFAKDGTVHYGSYKYESGNKYKVLKYKATYNGETFGPVTKRIYKIRQDNVCSTLGGLKAKLGDSNTYTSDKFDLNDLGIDCDSLEKLFHIKKSFNGNISYWDTSKVINMIEVFYYTEKFNQPIDNWDVSNVINMSGIFENNKKFNSSLKSWGDKLFSLKDCLYMFYNASFNQDINNWTLRNKIYKGFYNGEGRFDARPNDTPFSSSKVQPDYQFKYEFIED